jgi:hypothetical protein
MPMSAYTYRSGSNGGTNRPRTYDACMRRHVHGPIRPMPRPGLLERIFGSYQAR